MKPVLFLGLCLVLLGCQPTSPEDFQAEGRSSMRSLIKELKAIESREDLALSEPRLKKQFEKLVDIIIQARLFQQKNPEMEASWDRLNISLNQILIDEMKRVYLIEGGRECVERAQREAMLRLDAKEKLLEKQQSVIRVK